MSELEIQVKEIARQQAATNEQLKVLAEAMVSIAKIEERSHSMDKTLNGFGKRIDRMEKVLNDTVIQVALNGSQSSKSAQWIDTGIKILLGAVAGYVAFLFKT